MGQLEHVQQQLERTFESYLELERSEQDAAMDMTVLMLRQMLREHSGRQRRLTELGRGATERGTKSNAEKARSKLVRKTSAVSPKSPIKPVQVTKKNELRRE
jgi:hypothetical protein